MTREWFTTYCQNAAANVLDKDGKVRFDYTELKEALAAVTDDRHTSSVDPAIWGLHSNIVDLCNHRHPDDMMPNTKSALILTLLNIQAAYLMIEGLWKEEPTPQPDKDYCGFEIF